MVRASERIALEELRSAMPPRCEDWSARKVADVEAHLWKLHANNATRVRLWSMHDHNPRNVGDMQAVPFEHFPLLRALRAPGPPLPMWRSMTPGAVGTLKAWRRNLNQSTDILVVGGGGLIGLNHGWPKHIASGCSALKCVIWSVGYNKQNAVPLDVPALIDTHAGVAAGSTRLLHARSRDHGVALPSPWRYMLDASVFLPLQRCRERAPRHRVSYYYHGSFPVHLEARAARLGLAGPSLRHDVGAAQVIDFVCDTEVLVSSSYHGALWALLAGRRVVIAQVENPSSKFLTFEHQPPRISLRHRGASAVNSTELAAAIARAQPAPPDALEAARAPNRQLYGCLLAAIAETHCSTTMHQHRGCARTAEVGTTARSV
jgi:hypothetical protein